MGASSLRANVCLLCVSCVYASHKQFSSLASPDLASLNNQEALEKLIFPTALQFMASFSEDAIAKGDYKLDSSISDMIKSLGWNTLHDRRLEFRHRSSEKFLSTDLHDEIQLEGTAQRKMWIGEHSTTKFSSWCCYSSHRLGDCD